MRVKCKSLLWAVLLVIAPVFAFAQCEFGCKGKCTAFGITEPSCYNTCLQAEQACKAALPVVTPIVSLVAQNLEWSFVIAPIQSLSLLTINYLVQGSDGSKVIYPINIKKSPAPPTGVTRDIVVDCLYRTAPAGTTMFIAVTAQKPSWYDSISRGDDARTKSSNANCAGREGSTLITEASIRVDAKIATDEYTVFGRPSPGIAPAAMELRTFKNKPASITPQFATFYGILSESGTNYILRFLDPTADRSIEVSKAAAKVEQTEVYVWPKGGAAQSIISKVTLPASSVVTLRQSGAASSTLLSLARLQPLLMSSLTPGSAIAPQSILSLSAYPGDLACGLAKSTPIYWQAYALVKLAKDNGLIKNDAQCNNANYTATVVAAMIGGGDEIIHLLTGVYGSCICFDLF